MFDFASYSLAVSFLELSSRFAQYLSGCQYQFGLLLLLRSRLVEFRQESIVAVRRHASTFGSTKVNSQASNLISTGVQSFYVDFLCFFALKVVLVRAIQKFIWGRLSQNTMIFRHNLLISGGRIDQILSIVWGSWKRLFVSVCVEESIGVFEYVVSCLFWWFEDLFSNWGTYNNWAKFSIAVSA